MRFVFLGGFWVIFTPELLQIFLAFVICHNLSILGIQRQDMQKIYLLSDVSVAPSKGDELRAFSGVANSGKPFLHNGKPTIVDFDGVSFAQSVPVLLEHDRSDRLGFGTLSITDNQLTISGTLINNELGKKVAFDADNGFPFQMSAHVSPTQVVTLTGNQTAIVNGQTVKAPMTILKKCRIPEVSFTPTGVDSNTHATVLSDNPNQPQEQPMEQSEIDKLNAKIKELEAQSAEKDKKIEALTTENEQLKAGQARAEVDTQLSQAGFKKDEKGNWQGISPNTYNALLSQSADDVKVMIGDLKPKTAGVPDYLFSEQFGGGGGEQSSDTSLVAQAKARNKK